MSVQFKLVKIYVATATALMTLHDGTVTTNNDCCKGTVFGWDTEGNLYRCNHRSIAESLADCHRSKKPKTLYRDYWTHIAAGPNTPYGASFVNAQARILVG